MRPQKTQILNCNINLTTAGKSTSTDYYDDHTATGTINSNLAMHKTQKLLSSKEYLLMICISGSTTFVLSHGVKPTPQIGIFTTNSPEKRINSFSRSFSCSTALIQELPKEE